MSAQLLYYDDKSEVERFKELLYFLSKNHGFGCSGACKNRGFGCSDEHKTHFNLVPLYLCDPPVSYGRTVTGRQTWYCIIGYADGKFYLATYKNRKEEAYCPIKVVILDELIECDREELKKFVPENNEPYGYCFSSIGEIKDKIKELEDEHAKVQLVKALADCKLNFQDVYHN